ncbi:MAG: sulfatase-like hydrolase/transferase [Verrucomicrobiota bacterium]
MPSNHGDLTGIYVENRFVYGLRNGKIPPGMKLPGPVPDDDNFKGTYGPEDTESGRAKILDLAAPRRVNERVMPTLADRAVKWIGRQDKQRPFFLYFTPVAVHNPVTPDKDIAGTSAAGLYGDWIFELDRSVGRILDALEKQGVAGSTLVIFTSDNGGVKEPQRTDSFQTKALNAGLQVNGPWRGGKHHVWEGGFRVPFIVRWPGKVPAGTVCPEMISLADLLSTTAALVGEKLPPADKAAEDSYNILPAILGEPTPAPLRRDMIVHSADGVFAIRQGPWKWIEGVPVDEIKPGQRKARAEEYKPQLYNLVSDPAETNDVSAANPELVKEFRALLERYRNGGYSRELPPIMEKAKPVVAVLPAPTGRITLNAEFQTMPVAPWAVTRGQWSAKDGGVWGLQKPGDEQGACLHGPLTITNGTIQYEINFKGANRHSLRVETGDRQHSFRIEIARAYVGLTKNPSRGEGVDQTEPLARKPLKLESGQWYPVRITCQGSNATVQVNDVKITGAHPVIGEPKTGMNVLVFGETAGFRNLKVAE